MRDDDHGRPAPLELRDCFGERSFAELIEMCIRLIHHDEFRIAEDRARHPDPLMLPA